MLSPRMIEVLTFSYSATAIHQSNTETLKHLPNLCCTLIFISNSNCWIKQVHACRQLFECTRFLRRCFVMPHHTCDTNAGAPGFAPSSYVSSQHTSTLAPSQLLCLLQLLLWTAPPHASQPSFKRVTNMPSTHPAAEREALIHGNCFPLCDHAQSNPFLSLLDFAYTRCAPHHAKLSAIKSCRGC